VSKLRYRTLGITFFTHLRYANFLNYEINYNYLRALFSIIIIFTISIIIPNVLGQNETGDLHDLIPKWLTSKSPLEQYNSGISANMVVCQENLQLVMKTRDNSPACVKPETVDTLLERGWAKNTTSTLSGFLEQSYRNATYRNGTAIDSHDIDVKLYPIGEGSNILVQIFFVNGTLYKTDSIPITNMQPDGYYRYHIDTRSNNYTSQGFKANISYNNDSVMIYMPSVNESDDVFGVKEIYPTKKDGPQWYMNSSDPLNDTIFYTGPDSNASCDDPTTCMQLYKNPTDDSWHAKRIDVPENEGVRLVVNSPPNTLWLNTEMTGYYRLQNSTHYPQEFTHVTKSGSPHVSICQGYSYYSSITYDGIAEVQKSLYHAGDKSSYSETFATTGVTDPLTDRWIGMKTMTYNIKNNTAVKFEIWIDDQGNNNWHKVFEQIDSGWPVPGDPAKYGCKNIATGDSMNNNDIISWGGTEQQFRADNAEFDFKKLSIREIIPPIS